jgi:hypothetical protein
MIDMFPDRGGRRLCDDRREFSFTAHIPERRTGNDRRNELDDRRSGLDRRKLERSSPGLDRRKALRNLQFNDEYILWKWLSKVKT